MHGVFLCKKHNTNDGYQISIPCRDNAPQFFLLVRTLNIQLTQMLKNAEVRLASNTIVGHPGC